MSAFAGQAQAEDSTMPGTLTGGVSINSDYMSRGISQTANSAAVMGWLDWAFDTGYEGTSVYVGGFAANVDFPAPMPIWKPTQQPVSVARSMASTSIWAWPTTLIMVRRRR